MEDVPRWDCVSGQWDLPAPVRRVPGTTYVLYDDHLAALERMRVERDRQWIDFLRASGSIASGLLTTLDLAEAGKVAIDRLIAAATTGATDD